MIRNLWRLCRGVSFGRHSAEYACAVTVNGRTVALFEGAMCDSWKVGRRRLMETAKATCGTLSLPLSLSVCLSLSLSLCLCQSCWFRQGESRHAQQKLKRENTHTHTHSTSFQQHLTRFICVVRSRLSEEIFADCSRRKSIFADDTPLPTTSNNALQSEVR